MVRAEVRAVRVGARSVRAEARQVRAEIRSIRLGARSLQPEARSVRAEIRSARLGVPSVQLGARSVRLEIRSVSVGVRPIEVAVGSVRPPAPRLKLGRSRNKKKTRRDARRGAIHWLRFAWLPPATELAFLFRLIDFGDGATTDLVEPGWLNQAAQSDVRAVASLLEKISCHSLYHHELSIVLDACQSTQELFFIHPSRSAYRRKCQWARKG